MSDPIAARLDRLAPAVDLDASRELFESLRSEDASDDQQRPSRRWLLAAACVLLLVTGAVGVWAAAGRDGGRAPATSPATVPADETQPATADSAPPRADGTEFRLIAMEPVGDFERRGIHVADTLGELDDLLAGYRDSFDRHAAEVAFEASAEIAVVIERSDNACPLEIERFAPVAVDSTWRVEWADQSPEPCPDIGLGWVYLVAIPRSALAGIDRIVLPAEQLGSTELPELSAIVADTPPASAPESTTVTASPEVLHTGTWPSGARDRAIEAALNDAEFESMWARWVDPAQPRPDVDLDGVVVVAFEVGGGLCPQRFDHLQHTGPVRTPVVVEDQEGRDDCAAEIALGWVNVVQIERSSLGRSATIAHPSGRSAVRLDELATPPGRRTDVPVVAEVQAPLGTILAARDPVTYAAMWAQLGTTVGAPSIDFDRDVAVAFVIPDAACPPAFTGFDVAAGDPYPTWTPTFVRTQTACRLPLISRLFVIALDRSSLGTGVTFGLAADQTYDVPEQRYQVRLAEPSLMSGNSSCGPADAPTVDVFVFFNTPIDVRIVVRDGETTLGEQRMIYDAALAGEVHGGVVRQVPIDIPATPTPFGEVLLVDGDDPDRILDRIPFDRTSVPDGFGCG